MAVVIKEVMNHRDLKKFIKFPFELYSDNKYWVPPLLLDEKNNLNKKKIPPSIFAMQNTGLLSKTIKLLEELPE